MCGVLLDSVHFCVNEMAKFAISFRPPTYVLNDNLESLSSVSVYLGHSVVPDHTTSKWQNTI